MKWIAGAPAECPRGADRFLAPAACGGGFSEDAVIVVAEQSPGAPVAEIEPTDLASMSWYDVVEPMLTGFFFEITAVVRVFFLAAFDFVGDELFRADFVRAARGKGEES